MTSHPPDTGSRAAVPAPRPAVLVVGHGSHKNAWSSDPVHRVARRLRESGRYPEVGVAFWKEEPQLRHAFLLMESPEVVVVPVFTSEGYFTDRVLPRELGIEPPESPARRAGGGGTGGAGGGPDTPLRVRYTRPVGVHPAMRAAVLERALERIEGGDDVTLVVLGHGTERHPDSGAVTERIADELGRITGFGRVTSAFLDQDPRMLPVLEAVETPRAVVVPFFIAEGWHVGETIPRDLGLEEGRARVGRSEIIYTEPVGTHPAVADVVGRLVDEAWEASKEARSGSTVPTPATLPVELEPLPVRARASFVSWVDGGGEEGRDFLQTRVRRAAGGYEIRHVEDAGRSAGEMERHADARAAREIAARTADGEHRYLKTAPTLRRGWLLEGLDARGVWEAYAHLYPTVPVHRHLEEERVLPVVSFRETAERQTGIYSVVKELDRADVEAVRAECCGPGSCLRTVRWPVERGQGETAPGPGHAGAGPGDAGAGGTKAVDATASEGTAGEGDEAATGVPADAPCPEPCSVFIARARERWKARTSDAPRG